MSIPIKKTMDRIPGGWMLVPLLLGAAIHTIWPDAGPYFGSFTGALFAGALPILAVFFFCMGASIDVRATPYILKRGGSLFAAKIGTAVILGLVLSRFMTEKPIESGFFAGLSVLAVVAAFNDTNGGLYMALTKQFGDPRDVAAYSILSIESGPFLTMLTLGAAGLSAFPWQTLVGAILPLLLGALVGNLDHDCRDFFAPIASQLIPFFAFGLGAAIDLKTVWKAGLLGVLLGLSVVALTGGAMYLIDRLTGGKGVAGVAAASTAGNAAAVPAVVAAANPAYKDAAGPATMLVASSVVVTCIVVPLVTAWLSARVNRKYGVPAADGTMVDDGLATDRVGAGTTGGATELGRAQSRPQDVAETAALGD